MHILRHLLPALALAALSISAVPMSARAQSDAAPEAPTDPLRLELNRLDTVPGACRLILVAENPAPDGIDALVLEAVLFDRDGRVALLTLLDLQDLPAGRMRVRSFDLAGLDCADLGRLLVNGIDSRPQGAAICAADPALSSQVDVELRQ